MSKIVIGEREFNSLLKSANVKKESKPRNSVFSSIREKMILNNILYEATEDNCLLYIHKKRKMKSGKTYYWQVVFGGEDSGIYKIVEPKGGSNSFNLAIDNKTGERYIFVDIECIDPICNYSWDGVKNMKKLILRENIMTEKEFDYLMNTSLFERRAIAKGNPKIIVTFKNELKNKKFAII